MSMQIKTTEGILTLSNASDVRETGILVVRGHKGATLGFIAPVTTGWIGVTGTLEDMQVALALPVGYHDAAGTLEQAAEHVVRYGSH